MYQTMWLKVFVVLTFLATLCHGANILAFPVSNSYSHFIVMEPLFKELAARGHQVTVVSSFPQKQIVKNYYDIDVGYLMPPIRSNFSFDMATDMGKNPLTNMKQIWDVGNRICDTVLSSGELRELYNSTAHFDLVITHCFAYDCFAVFAHKFNTPIVTIVTASALPWSNPRVGNPDHPAYIVNNYINSHEDMTLYQRTVNTLAWLMSTIAIHPLNYDLNNAPIQHYLDASAPTVQDIISSRTSLVMVNSHFSMLQSRPLVPNFVEIGGIHIKDAKPIPKDFKNFMDDATHGVILFSLGSLVRASSMSNSTFQALMGAFATLNQRVVFKFEEDVVDGIPPNVMVRKWLPQRDLLAHHNVRLLMAHGGQSSTIEAVYTGTPMVGMPLFSDQYNNIQTLVLKGAAELLDLHHLTKERVLEAVTKVLNNSRYKTNAERLSRQFKDRLATPLDTAVYWTEYVLRHRGAPQLRCQLADLPWYRFLLLDVIAVLVLGMLASIFTVRTIIKYALYSVICVYRRTEKSKDD
ncbi:UDP-glucosyltransferase 2-like [Homalodisca vitripennis]|uniref:UDP-glucosyltransferase 2-like n=1 Tax=Homalodisca vitripennis TaxID=197043 RepID=UPI001EEA6DC3|nr:UDP-glucosyltransferase 2-like [Homalodisca vitripennis]